MFKYSKVMSNPGLALAGPSGAVGLVRGMEKTSQATHLSGSECLDPRIAKYIQDEASSFDEDTYTYALVVPLGADESWEETANGDAFLREDISPDRSDWGHKTFETLSNAFMHHRNKDPAQGFGKIIKAVFNPQMDRVEAVWRLDNEKAKKVGSWDFVSAIQNNRPANISMGTHVPFDVCSVCGNAARNLSEYCAHPKSPGFGSLTPDGVKVRVYNPTPRFFDLSGVTVNAAYEAAVLALLGKDFREQIAMIKSSSAGGSLEVPYIPSALLGEAMYGGGLSKFSSRDLKTVKVSDLIKEVPALMSEVIAPLIESEEDLEFDSKVDPKHSSLPEILSTLAGLGIILKPREFTKAASLFGLCDSATEIPIEDIRRAFPLVAPLSGVDPRGYSPTLAGAFHSDVPARSILFPVFGERLAKQVREGSGARRAKAPRVTIEVRVDGVPGAAAYASYIKALTGQFSELLSSLFRTQPGLPGLLGTGNIKVAGRDPRAMVLPFAYLGSLAGVADPRTVVSMMEKNSDIRTAHYLGGSV